ncbi:hypothetical protein N789_10375 [Arenimonas oryziterrae DSM 21050 = YC6267]|uniref:Beta-lactamase n=2 Tax=Arenimonas TaxID=490567 RepID=A0A091ATZ5_9GAMM|nr:hypothetical protein N789_10375 [Arenimonas oryziterrae DSM 21050 = YC6267]
MSGHAAWALRWRRGLSLAALTGLLWVGSAAAIELPWKADKKPAVGSCFLLFEVGKGEVRRAPDEVCDSRVTPASTFKIPHSLIALDTGAVSGPDEVIPYDGSGNWPESSKRDHTLASALQNSVVWYYQKVAERVGEKKEAAYLRKFAYGNADSESGLTTFWLGGSLQITPEEQLDFLRRFYDGKLPVKFESMTTVMSMLLQPPGVVVNSLGEHPFDAPWPAGTSVAAKTGSGTDADGRTVRWLVGRVRREGSSYLFVSCVIGDEDTPAEAAIDLAAKSLRENGVL